MRHALMAEKQRSETYQKIKELTNDCEKLEDLVDQLNQDAVDVVKADAEERAEVQKDHEEYKAKAAQAIFEIKDQLDGYLQNPNMIA